MAAQSSLFKKGRRLRATLKHWAGKLVKAKQGKESGLRRMLFLQFHVPVTKELRDALPPLAQGMVRLDGKETAGPFDQARFTSVDQAVNVSVFSFQNFSNTAEPKVAFQARLILDKLALVDSKTVLQISIKTPYSGELWGWLGANFGEEDCVLGLIELQGELDFEKAAGAAPEAATEKNYYSRADWPRLSTSRA